MSGNDFLVCLKTPDLGVSIYSSIATSGEEVSFRKINTYAPPLLSDPAMTNILGLLIAMSLSIEMR